MQQAARQARRAPSPDVIRGRSSPLAQRPHPPGAVAAAVAQCRGVRASGGASAMDASAAAKLTVPLLRAELEKRGLDTKGLKAQLVERLTKALADADAAPAASDMAVDEPPQPAAAVLEHGSADAVAAARDPPAATAPQSLPAAGATQPHVADAPSLAVDPPVAAPVRELRSARRVPTLTCDGVLHRLGTQPAVEFAASAVPQTNASPPERSRATAAPAAAGVKRSAAQSVGGLTVRGVRQPLLSLSRAVRNSDSPFRLPRSAASRGPAHADRGRALAPRTGQATAAAGRRARGKDIRGGAGRRSSRT